MTNADGTRKNDRDEETEDGEKKEITGSKSN